MGSGNIEHPEPSYAPYTDKEWEQIGDDVLEAWKKTIDVQQQFNDIELRIRNYAITLLVAIVGAAAFSAKEKVKTQIFGWPVPLGAPLIFAGLVSLAGFYFMDRFWYHRLLQGAVEHGMRIEARCANVCDAIGLGRRIKTESPIRALKLHSEGKIDIFYGLIALMLILMIVSFGFSTP